MAYIPNINPSANLPGQLVSSNPSHTLTGTCKTTATTPILYFGTIVAYASYTQVVPLQSGAYLKSLDDAGFGQFKAFGALLLTQRNNFKSVNSSGVPTLSSGDGLVDGSWGAIVDHGDVAVHCETPALHGQAVYVRKFAPNPATQRVGTVSNSSDGANFVLTPWFFVGNIASAGIVPISITTAVFPFTIAPLFNPLTIETI
jgi:hypothetical protein